MTMRLSAVVAAALCVSPVMAQPAGLYLSVADNVGTQIGGGTFTDEDVILTDQTGSTASQFFTITSNDLDAFHIMDNGNYLVSSLFNGSVNGMNFADGDLIEYNPTTGQIVGTFRGMDEAHATAGGDWSAVTMDSAGNLYLSSLDTTSTINHAGGSLTFSDGDIIMVDSAGVASLFLSAADIFDDGDGDIYGMHWMADGSFLMSTASDESISGTTYLDGDVFSYDVAGDSASLFFSESSFTDTANGHDVDAIYYNIPAPAGLAAFGLAGLAASRRRRRILFQISFLNTSVSPAYESGEPDVRTTR